MLKVDIEGGEFAVFADTDTDWLARVDQIALEVHPHFGDIVPVIERLGYHGLRVKLCNNSGKDVPESARHLEYLYCHEQ